MMSGIPLPTQFTQMPGGPQGMYNALRQGSLQNEYYGPTQMADIASKTTYARYLPAQILGQVLANPLAWQTMDKNVLANLTNQYANALANPPSIQSLGGIPQNNGLFPFLMNKLGITPATNAMTALSPPTGSATPNAMTSTDFGASNRATPAEVTQVANNGNGQPVVGGYSTPATGQAGALTKPDSYGGLNPPSAAQAQQKGLETAVTGQTQAATEQWNTAQTQASNSARLATNLLNNANGFHTAYGRSFYTGARLGSLPSTGVFAPPTKSGNSLADEQLTDRYSNNMATALAPQLNQGHITDSNYNLVSRLKLSRDLDPDAEKSMYGSTVATAERLKTNQDFYNYIRRKNPDITQPEAEGLWNEYNNKMPPYNFNTLSPQPENNKKWKLFASPEAVAAYRENGSYTPKGSTNNTNASNNSNTYGGNSTKFDPVKMLDYKYSNADEFKQAFNSLNAANKQLVINEMNRRGWK